jgi:hypothetical protein
LKLQGCPWPKSHARQRFCYTKRSSDTFLKHMNTHLNNLL